MKQNLEKALDALENSLGAFRIIESKLGCIGEEIKHERFNCVGCFACYSALILEEIIKDIKDER